MMLDHKAVHPPIAAFLCLLASAVLLPACAASGVAPATPQQIEREKLLPPPIRSLLGEREALGLTSRQVEVLDSVAHWLGQTNDAFYEEMGGRTQQIWSEEPRRMPGSAVYAVRNNNDYAVVRVQETLTAEQREMVCEVFAIGGDSGEDSGGSAGPRADARYASAAGGAYTWPWCSGRFAANGSRAALADE